VIEVDHDELSVTFEGEAKFEVDQLAGPHATNSPQTQYGLNGAPVTQDTYVGDLTTLFARFGQEWTARWVKHLDTPESFWDPILQFVDMAIPVQDSMPYEPITPDQLLKRIRPKKPTAATGLDRWSRQDILHMAPDLLKSDMFAWVEQGNPCPPWNWGE